MSNEITLEGKDIRSLLHPYTDLSSHARQGPLVIDRGDGVYVFDTAGNRYIEGMSGLWCAALGFSQERLADAAHKQMKNLSFYHQFTGRSHEPGIELAEKLLSMAPEGMERVFFTCSGSEANDTQVKLVRYYHAAMGKPEKKKIISRNRGYHGVTLAAASMTMLPYAQNGFGIPLDDFIQTDSPHYYRQHIEGESEEDFATRCAENLDKLINELGPETVGGFIAEPVMGAGGVLLPPATYFDKISAVLKKHDVLLIADEVITGFGRTGHMFACETYGIKPDMMTIAKQLTAAALPLGAVMISDKVYQGLEKGSDQYGIFGHGYTYSGHPVSCAVALEALAIYDEIDSVGLVRQQQDHFAERVHKLGDHPLAGHTRAVGLIGAVEVTRDKDRTKPFDPSEKVNFRIVEAALKRGLILRAVPGDGVAFCPPLIIEESQIDTMFDIVEAAMDDILHEMS